MPSEYYQKKVKAIKDFDYTRDYSTLNLRDHPELYRIGRGEQGVLLVEPYKSEILPYRRFKTPEIAQTSAEKIYSLFEDYLKSQDFVGADMARKFLQMGYTRARRYANHPTGKKYHENPQDASTETEEKKLRKNIIQQSSDALTSEKAEAARIFYGYYYKAKTHPEYIRQKAEFIKKYLS